MRITNWALGFAVFASASGIAGLVSAEDISKTVKKQAVPLPNIPKPPAVHNNQSKGGGAVEQPALPGIDRRSKGGDGGRGGSAPDKHSRSGRIDPNRRVLAESDARYEDSRIREGQEKYAPDRAKLDRTRSERGGHSRSGDLAEKPGLEHGRVGMAVGRRQFAASSHWTGKRYSGDGEQDVRFDVTSFVGNSFGGVLSQRANGGEWVQMDVEGDVNGNSIAFHTTRMLEGKKRHLNFDGYFSGNQIKTDVSGRTWNGKEASGSMILCREGSHAIALNKHD